MLAQIVRAKVSDRSAIDDTFNRWSKELAPGAKGWLGTTGGVTEDGELFILIRFESEEAARANSERPEQDRFWSQTSSQLDGEATFQGSSEVYRPLGGSDTGSGPAVRLGVFGPETWPDSRVRRPPR